MGRSIRWLRAQNFDLVIDLQCLARSAIFAWLANGKQLVGLDEVREGARGFYDLSSPAGPSTPMRWIGTCPSCRSLASPCMTISSGCPSARPPPPTFAKMAGCPSDHPNSTPDRGAPDGPFPPRWIALQPGARWQNKRGRWKTSPSSSASWRAQYPAARFAILGAQVTMSSAHVIAEAAPARCLNLCGANHPARNGRVDPPLRPA